MTDEQKVIAQIEQLREDTVAIDIASMESAQILELKQGVFDLLLIVDRWYVNKLLEEIS